MNEQDYFEQFTGDVEMIELRHISMRLKAFMDMPPDEQIWTIRNADVIYMPGYIYREYIRKTGHITPVVNY